MKKKIVYIVIIAVIVLSVVAGVVGRNRTRLKKVDVYAVGLEDFRREVSSNGEIRSRESNRLISTVSGKVKSIHHEEGEYVLAGDVVVSLDTSDMELRRENLVSTLESTRIMVRKELLSLRSAYMQASTAYEQAERDYLRSEDLRKKEFASEVELQAKRDAFHIAYDNLTSAMQQLRFREGRDPEEGSPDSRTDDQIVEESSEVKQALLNLRSHESDMEDFIFRASIDGIITALPVEEGDVVSPGMLIASVHNSGALKVAANIDEVDLSYLSVGQDVKIESDSFIGTELKGRVSYIAPIIQKIGDSRVCSIEVDILENPGDVARIGASCSIFITVENRTERPAIPVESYFIEDDGKYVFLLEQDQYDDNRFLVKKQEIETGILGIETVEVTDGLSEGDFIISSDRAGIVEGDEVERSGDNDQS
ncbi:efflux RND transporter periplasmic adaptor subunit [Spirochaeta isovalerica]|uniref:RND family efflux transporter MFP subunit n=1 Tax=Spirochaeta isovalerica TaxID=150 RepID=A0A841RAN6_9SPIO|nr:efflux RND transporter periplasmic adaptor subunit [Spirochaeta isovalerica]MBB6481005.1 RND family efflux transporter MFP subunit [Spirochaeta isovalerica]